MKNTAIVLAAGQGSRMKSDIAKQYLLLRGKPVLYYSLQAFSSNSNIEDIILVAGSDEIEYCQKNIVDFYGFSKVKNIISGGKERYDSVYNGLCAVRDRDYVFIHDGARPFVDECMINRVLKGAEEYGACIVGMPVKDTIKISDKDGKIIDTPCRDNLWTVQTPQVFSYELINRAYSIMIRNEDIKVTDDAMVVEKILDYEVRIVEGSYKNIKITTPEDMVIADALFEYK